MTIYTINNLPTEYANKTVCCFCSQYAENFCHSCNEYKGIMTLAEFMTTYEIDEWVADESNSLNATLDALIAKGVYN